RNRVVATQGRSDLRRSEATTAEPALPRHQISNCPYKEKRPLGAGVSNSLEADCRLVLVAADGNRVDAAHQLLRRAARRRAAGLATDAWALRDAGLGRGHRAARGGRRARADVARVVVT